jgi:hypothetical protein
MNSVITLTFGDMAENHVGMEQIGKLVAAGEGFQVEDLCIIKEKMESIGGKCEMIELSGCGEDLPVANVLVIRDGVDLLLSEDGKNKNELCEEQMNLTYDKKAFMYGRVVNKNARWNLCYDEKSRDPDYEKGMGRIVGYDEVPITKKLMDCFERNFGPKASCLKIESNYYYDIKKCGIGFHGDSERRKVIGVRLGADVSTPLHFQWYYKGSPMFDRITIPLNGGDIYIMSEKAVGTDWKKKLKYTLRHATGCNKFLTLKKKTPPKK